MDPLSEPRDVVGLSEALIALREELLAAWQEGEGEGRRLRFRVPEPIELTFQAVVTQEGKANAGVKWWLLSLGGGGIPRLAGHADGSRAVTGSWDRTAIVRDLDTGTPTAAWRDDAIMQTTAWAVGKPICRRRRPRSRSYLAPACPPRNRRSAFALDAVAPPYPHHSLVHLASIADRSTLTASS